MDYLLHILFLVAIYTVLAVSLNLLAGYTGLLSIAHASFYGLGAYTTALLAVRFGTPFVFNLLIGVILAALISCLISLPSLRLHDDYFVIATFGFQMILFSVFNNWTSVTRGALGIPGVPPPSFIGWTIGSRGGMVALAVAHAVLAYIIVNRLTTSPLGRVLMAIREDEVFAQSLGKNTLLVKVTIFAVSAALASSAGALYAHYITVVSPTSFSFTESMLMISMVIVGGAGSTWGPLIGAAILIFIPETLRSLNLPSAISRVEPNLRQIIYGCLLVLMMAIRPAGLIGRFSFGKKR